MNESEGCHKVVVVTGGAQGIGKCIAEGFRQIDATVYVIDKQPGDWFVGDLSDKTVLERFADSELDRTISVSIPRVRKLSANLVTLMQCRCY